MNIQMKLSDFLLRLQADLPTEASDSGIAAFRFMLQANKGKTMLEFQELKFGFHWMLMVFYLFQRLTSRQEKKITLLLKLMNNFLFKK